MRVQPQLTLALSFLGGGQAAQATRYSTWMASSIISRGQGVYLETGDSSQLLQAGITQKAFRRLVEQYPDDSASAAAIADYLAASVDSVVPVVSNATADTKFSLDRLSTGNNLLARYEETGNATYRAAAEALRGSIDRQPRNAEGGLWYYVYPQWSYLDGMYSLAPFYVSYAARFTAGNASTATDAAAAAAATADVLHQLDLLWQHCLRNDSGLLVHGYDESRTAVWADPATGASPHVWGRSLGWYAMALVDTLELFAPGSAERRHLAQRFRLLARALVSAVDPQSGAWWQVLDRPGAAGNYIESSGSSMFVYALLKGLRLGVLGGRGGGAGGGGGGGGGATADGGHGHFSSSVPPPSAAGYDDRSGGGSSSSNSGSSYADVATRAYGYVVDNFVVHNGNGTAGWNGTVAVCSLNSTASYEYYVGQPILYNSVLGSAAFVLASLEYEAHVAASGKRSGVET